MYVRLDKCGMIWFGAVHPHTLQCLRFDCVMRHVFNPKPKKRKEKKRHTLRCVTFVLFHSFIHSITAKIINVNSFFYEKSRMCT